jgi:hypothetical protein
VSAYASLVVYAAVTLLPIVPAFLLFRFLPAPAQARGQFQGLRVKFGGAFAGYLVTFLLLLRHVHVDVEHYDTLHLRGTVQFDVADSDVSAGAVTLFIRPPELQLRNDRSFAFDIPVLRNANGDTEFPQLFLDAPGFDLARVDFHNTYITMDGVRIGMQREPGSQYVQLEQPLVLKSKSRSPDFKPNTSAILASR